MGTETHFVKELLLVCIEMVKLNNPLMGTETKMFFVTVLIIYTTFVKLNNPLMGTETRNSMPPHSPRIITQLN